jgi:hypothetical protein
VENGKLFSIDGDKRKHEVEQTVLQVVLDFLENRKTA